MLPILRGSLCGHGKTSDGVRGAQTSAGHHRLLALGGSQAHRCRRARPLASSKDLRPVIVVGLVLTMATFAGVGA